MGNAPTKTFKVQQRKFVHGILTVRNGTKMINNVDSTDASYVDLCNQHKKMIFL